MKHKTNYFSYNLILFVVLLLFSCNIKQVPIKDLQTQNETKNDQITLIEIKDDKIITLPDKEDSLFIYQLYNVIINEDTLVEYGSSHLRMEPYPVYDINNTPISVWFIKKESKFLGFIVAGHATKAICEVASLEVRNNFDKIGDNETSIFSYGIGYYLIEEENWTQKFDNQLMKMKSKFIELQNDIDTTDMFSYNYQVDVNEIYYEDYMYYKNLFKEHIDIANSSDLWDTHLVEYKIENLPLIVPFFDTKNKTKIKFEVPKHIFGEIPTELVQASNLKHLNEFEVSLKKSLDLNLEIINSVRECKITDYDYYWQFRYRKYENSILKTDSFELFGYEKPPEGWYIEKQDYSGGKTRTPITLNQAVNYLNDATVIIKENDRKKLEEWKKDAAVLIKGFSTRKDECIEQLLSENNTIENKLKDIQLLINDLNELDDQGQIVDAFLRGWVFEAGDDELNEQLDNWYLNYRKPVWEFILNQFPNAKLDSKMGGIFHADDVYFQVRSKDSNLIITPYKVVGDNFIQVINKEIGLSYLQTPYNFRDN